MSETSKTTIFFGSGPVAAQSLQKLLLWQPVAAVVTKRTPAHHKEPAPVETLANQHNIPLFFADTKAELDTLITSGTLPNTLFGIVIDYGVIMSKQTIEHFAKGIINSHFSLLPEWRGADPITFALLSGQQTTGVSIMCIDEGLDTGDLLTTAPYTIKSTDTNTSLTNELISLSDTLLRQCIPGYLDGTITPHPQPQAIATYSKKLHKTSGVINCNKPATVIEREIRAFEGWPTSRLLVQDTWITIHVGRLANEPIPAGTLAIYNKQLLLGTRLGSLEILSLQPAGKKIMDAPAFINGYAHLATKV